MIILRPVELINEHTNVSIMSSPITFSLSISSRVKLSPIKNSKASHSRVFFCFVAAESSLTAYVNENVIYSQVIVVLGTLYVKTQVSGCSTEKPVWLAES